MPHTENNGGVGMQDEARASYKGLPTPMFVKDKETSAETGKPGAGTSFKGRSVSLLNAITRKLGGVRGG